MDQLARTVLGLLLLAAVACVVPLVDGVCQARAVVWSAARLPALARFRLPGSRRAPPAAPDGERRRSSRSVNSAMDGVADGPDTLPPCVACSIWSRWSGVAAGEPGGYLRWRG